MKFPIGNVDAMESDEVREKIMKVVNAHGGAMTKEQKKDYAKFLYKIFNEGMSPKEAMGIPEAQIAIIARNAYNFFVSGHYREASDLFEILQTLEPTKAFFAISLGVCYHRMKNFEKALTNYIKATVFDVKDPVPFFYAYDCCLNLKNEILALMMIRNAIARAGDEPKYAMLKQKAALIEQELDKKVHEERAQKKTAE